jgi:hypothetical protein
MIVVDNRRGESETRSVAWQIAGKICTLRALHHPPAEVHSAGTAGADEINLFARTLSHVADEQIARHSIEAEPPRVAQSVRPDLGAYAGLRRPHKRVVGRNAVGKRAGCGIHVDAKYFAQQAGEVLCMILRIIPRAAIAHPDIEMTVGIEAHRATIVIGVGLRDR